MRFRVRYVLLIIPVIALMLYLGIKDDSKRHFCKNCGLMRFSKTRYLFGLSNESLPEYRETEFHQMLLSTGRIRCSHNWQAFCWNHHNVHRGEVHIPYILTDYGWTGSRLDLLSRLEDPDKAATILTSLDLSDIFDEQHIIDDDRAFDALKSVPLDMSEQEWWAKFRSLFEGRLKPNQGLLRTPVARQP
jgi:hypothetical protein